MYLNKGSWFIFLFTPICGRFPISRAYFSEQQKHLKMDGLEDGSVSFLEPGMFSGAISC